MFGSRTCSIWSVSLCCQTPLNELTLQKKKNSIHAYFAPESEQKFLSLFNTVHTLGNIWFFRCWMLCFVLVVKFVVLCWNNTDESSETEAKHSSFETWTVMLFSYPDSSGSRWFYLRHPSYIQVMLDNPRASLLTVSIGSSYWKKDLNKNWAQCIHPYKDRNVKMLFSENHKNIYLHRFGLEARNFSNPQQIKLHEQNV